MAAQIFGRPRVNVAWRSKTKLPAAQWEHPERRCNGFMHSQPTTFIAEWFHSAKAISSISESSGTVWMEGLSDIESNPICDDSSIVWMGPNFALLIEYLLFCSTFVLIYNEARHQQRIEYTNLISPFLYLWHLIE